MCGSFLRVRRKFSEDPIKSLLMSYQPELGHMSISEPITDKKYGFILIPVCLILDLRVGSVSLRDVGYVVQKTKLGSY